LPVFSENRRTVMSGNCGSRDHLGMRLQAVYGWKPKKFGKDGKPSVDESTLEEVVEDEPAHGRREDRIRDLLQGALVHGGLAVLAEVYGWKPKKFGKDGKPSVDESTLEEIPDAVLPAAMCRGSWRPRSSRG
jgi:hypothetical protein